MYIYVLGYKMILRKAIETYALAKFGGRRETDRDWSNMAKEEKEIKEEKGLTLEQIREFLNKDREEQLKKLLKDNWYY